MTDRHTHTQRPENLTPQPYPITVRCPAGRLPPLSNQSVPKCRQTHSPELLLGTGISLDSNPSELSGIPTPPSQPLGSLFTHNSQNPKSMVRDPNSNRSAPGPGRVHFGYTWERFTHGSLFGCGHADTQTGRETEKSISSERVSGHNPSLPRSDLPTHPPTTRRTPNQWSELQPHPLRAR